MRLIVRALMHQKKSTLIMLFLCMFIVFQSLHVVNSLSHADLRLVRDIDEVQSSHTSIKPRYNRLIDNSLDGRINAMKDFHSQIEGVLSKYDLSYEKSLSLSKTINYADPSLFDEDFMDGDAYMEHDVTIDFEEWTPSMMASHVTYAGKDHRTLENNEVAISRHFEKILRSKGLDPFKETVSLSDYYYSYDPNTYEPYLIGEGLKEYKIVSVVDTLRSDLSHVETEALQKIDFFQQYESDVSVYLKEGTLSSYIDELEGIELQYAQFLKEQFDENYELNAYSPQVSRYNFNYRVRFDNYSRALDAEMEK